MTEAEKLKEIIEAQKSQIYRLQVENQKLKAKIMAWEELWEAHQKSVRETKSFREGLVEK